MSKYKGHNTSMKSNSNSTRSQRRRPAFRGAYNSFDGKATFQGRCHKILDKLKKHKFSEPFLVPVDYVALNIPDYPKIITEPMDISTIEKNLRDHEYSAYAEFETDVRKIWNNALKYNPAMSQIYNMTLEIQRYFEKINLEEQEMHKYNKMKNKMLIYEKKGNNLQTKGGSQRHSKSSSYKNQNTEQPLTYQEKKNLSTMIRSLETEHLLGVWEIVSEGNDQIKDNEIEFDIETLPVRKARELEKYVQRKLELMRKNEKKVKSDPVNPVSAPVEQPKVVPLKNPENPAPVTAPVQESNTLKNQTPAPGIFNYYFICVCIFV